jgi:hypothetical protein
MLVESQSRNSLFPFIKPKKVLYSLQLIIIFQQFLEGLGF